MIPDVREYDAEVFWDSSGLTIFRNWLVTSAETSSSSAGQRLAAAKNLVPFVGSAHPDFNQHKLREIQFRLASPLSRDILARGKYLAPSVPEYSIQGSLEATDTNLDKDGQVITTNGDGGPQGHLVEYHRPLIVLVAKKSFTMDPMILKTYEWKLNLNTWPTGSSPDPPGRWLCTSVEILGLDLYVDGATYEAVLEFRRKGEGWHRRVVHEENGEPIAEPVLGASMIDYDLYELQDFSPLAIVL